MMLSNIKSYTNNSSVFIEKDEQDLSIVHSYKNNITASLKDKKNKNNNFFGGLGIFGGLNSSLNFDYSILTRNSNEVIVIEERIKVKITLVEAKKIAMKDMENYEIGWKKYFKDENKFFVSLD